MHPIDEQDNLKPSEAIKITSNGEGTTDLEARPKLQSRNRRQRHSMRQKSKSNFYTTKQPPPPRPAQPVKHPQEQRPLSMTRSLDRASGTILTEGRTSLPKKIETT